MARFVFVHGAWHGGWCFELVRGELERRGHTVDAPDLPCDRVGLTPLDYAGIVGPQPDAVVVGHSLGGLTIPFVEAGMRVYLAALLPVADVYRDGILPEFGGTLRDEQGRSYWADEETACRRMYPDCTRALAEAAFVRLRPQAPLQALEHPVDEDDVVVATMRDGAVDPAWQLRTGREHVRRVHELDAGHSPFFTHPVELADLLETLA